MNQTFSTQSDSTDLPILFFNNLLCSLTILGVVVALDKQSTALCRTWCLYEISIALRLKGQTKIRLALGGGF